MGNQIKKLGKVFILVFAMLVCFNIGVMAQEIEATTAPNTAKEVDTTKLEGESETTKPASEGETTTQEKENETDWSCRNSK